MVLPSRFTIISIKINLFEIVLKLLTFLLYSGIMVVQLLTIV